jgi:cytochrome c nitrite reductase small subunit
MCFFLSSFISIFVSEKFKVCKNKPWLITMKALDKITNLFSRRQKIFLLVVAGVICGLGGLFLYLLRAHTYIADDPSACVNCHIMTPYYVTWSHSSHGRDATCNDCHVPHQNLALKYGFKAMDGLKHVAYFVTHSERQTIMAEEMSAEVIMDNCIRCHTQLNQEFVKTGRMGYSEQMREGGKVCWDCHRNVPHSGMNSLSSTPNAEGVTPLPPSPVPNWLQNLMNK